MSVQVEVQVHRLRGPEPPGAERLKSIPDRL
jgi:hypothetical protein